MQLDLTPIWYQEIDLIGTLAHGMETWPIGTHEQRSTFSIAAEMIESEQIHPEKLITHRFALTNYLSALATATAKSLSRAIKVVFDFALLPVSLVLNVRSSARERLAVTTVAVWPQEQQSTHEETNMAKSPDEYFIQPVSAFAPEPAEIPLPTTPGSIVEIEQAPQFSTEEQSALEDQNQTNTSVISKPKRSRQSTQSHKNTEDIQASAEAIGNTTGTNPASDTLEKYKYVYLSVIFLKRTS